MSARALEDINRRLAALESSALRYRKDASGDPYAVWRGARVSFGSGGGPETDPLSIHEDIFNAKGDLIGASAANTPGILTVGLDGRFLKTDAAQALGLVWAALAIADVSGLQAALDAKQGLDDQLTDLAGLTQAANKGIYFDSSTTAATWDLSPYGRTITGLADAAALRSNLGLGALALLGAGTGLESSGGNLRLATQGSGISGGGGSLLSVDTSLIATRAYVDALAQSLDIKFSCRVATTGAITIATALNNGDTIDGVVLATGDRVLVKDQATASQNGIYVVGPAPARASDADTSADVTAGLFTFITEGTTNADSGWVLTTNDPIVLDSTNLAFAQFSGAGQITAGNALTKTGNTLDVAVDNSTIEISGDALRLKAAGILASHIGDAELAALAGLVSAANKIPMFSGAGTATLLDLDTDGTLAANSDTRLASQKAVKTYAVTGPATSTADNIAGWNGTGGRTLKDTTAKVANVPTDGEKSALVGSYGSPGATNRYVLEDDPGLAALPIGLDMELDVVSNIAAATGTLNWNHGGAADARAALVLAAHPGSTSEFTGTATYGGQTMQKLGTQLVDAGAEDGVLVAYFLDNIPTGTQAVNITVGGASSKRAVCYTVTAAGEVRAAKIATLDSSGVANPSVAFSLPSDMECFTAGILWSGQDAITAIAAGAGYTEDLEHDFGAQCAAWEHETVNSSGDRTMAWTVASEEAGILGIALTQAPKRDFGLYASSLPSKPTYGDTFTLLVSEDSGISGVGPVAMQYICDSLVDTTLPWNLISGGPCTMQDDSSRSLTNQTSFVSLPTDPMTFTMPSFLVGAWVDVECSASIGCPATASSFGNYGYSVGSTAASDAWAAIGQTAAAAAIFPMGASRTRFPSVIGFTALSNATPGTTDTIVEKARTGGNYTVSFSRRRIHVWLTRIG